MVQTGEWVTAADALKMLEPQYKTFSASRRICERAYAGLVRARAQHFQGRNGQTTTDVEIPKEFWWAEGYEALTQDWTAGDFSTAIGHVQYKAFGVTFFRADLEKIAPSAEQTTPSEVQNPKHQRYLHLAHLAETAPDFTMATTPDTRLWLAQARAAIREIDDLPNATAFEAALALYSAKSPGRHGDQILQCVYNALVQVGRDIPSSVRGAFIPAGNAHDAVVAVGKILGAAKAPIMLVDPYADAAILERYAVFAPEGVAINILADIKDSKPTLKPAAETWIKQYGSQRPLSVRLSPAKTLHDRLIILDDAVAYAVGQSFNALAARSPTSINRMDAETARRKIEAHQQFWKTATVLI